MFNKTDIHLDADTDYRRQLIKYNVIQDELKKIKRTINMGRCEDCGRFILHIGIISISIYYLQYYYNLWGR